MKRLMLAVCFASLTLSSQAYSKTVLKFGTVAPDNTPWAEELKGIEKRVASES
ncbi:MAG: hypothetical protein RJB38_364, partial [Pseudomonadota bacterium]